jgi:hypothetical protein
VVGTAVVGAAVVGTAAGGLCTLVTPPRTPEGPGEAAGVEATGGEPAVGEAAGGEAAGVTVAGAGVGPPPVVQPHGPLTAARALAKAEAVAVATAVATAWEDAAAVPPACRRRGAQNILTYCGLRGWGLLKGARGLSLREATKDMCGLNDCVEPADRWGGKRHRKIGIGVEKARQG